MDKQIGRRGLLKIVAGAVAGAIGANALVQKVAAKEPTAIVTNHETGIVHGGVISNNGGPWIAPWPETPELAILPSHDHYLPPLQYDSRLTILSTPNGPNWMPREYETIKIA